LQVLLDVRVELVLTFVPALENPGDPPAQQAVRAVVLGDRAARGLDRRELVAHRAHVGRVPEQL
jgi:hypothetical protein